MQVNIPLQAYKETNLTLTCLEINKLLQQTPENKIGKVQWQVQMQYTAITN